MQTLLYIFYSYSYNDCCNDLASEKISLFCAWIDDFLTLFPFLDQYYDKQEIIAKLPSRNNDILFSLFDYSFYYY